VGVVVALLVLAFFVSRGCQQDQIKVTQEEAIEIAEDQVDFEPRNTQIRLLRQGLDRHPIWVVSLTIPVGTNPDPDTFSRLALVRVDAESGEVQSVEEKEPADELSAEINVSQEEAISSAKDEIEFEPQTTQVRLLREGKDRRPFWVVTLSAPGDDAVVRVDANTGEVGEVREGS
jgi:uncharacterized membrane protein YkoI